jgi:hypothetical protein
MEYEDNSTVTVSPSRSAKSDTNIYIDSSFHELFKKMRAELKEEVIKDLLRRTKAYWDFAIYL